jgi:hypothetical protein
MSIIIIIIIIINCEIKSHCEKLFFSTYSRQYVSPTFGEHLFMLFYVLLTFHCLINTIILFNIRIHIIYICIYFIYFILHCGCNYYDIVGYWQSLILSIYQIRRVIDNIPTVIIIAINKFWWKHPGNFKKNYKIKINTTARAKGGGSGPGVHLP